MQHKIFIALAAIALVLTMSVRADVKEAYAQSGSEVGRDVMPVHSSKTGDVFILDEKTGEMIPGENNGVPENDLEDTETLPENFDEATRVTLPADIVINKDYFAAGEVVRISGTVNGDVYTAGGQVLIDGTVNGSVLAAGGSLEVTGAVTENVRITGGQVVVTGDIGKNLSVAAGNISITDGATIEGNVVAGAGNININAPVAGDMSAAVGQLTLLEKGTIGGDLTYVAQEGNDIDESRVLGTITKRVAPSTHQSEMSKDDVQDSLQGITTFFSVVSLISMFIVGLLLVYLYPQFMRNTTQTLEETPWKSIGIGFVSMLLMPLIAIMLIVTIVGVPLGVILLLAFGILLYLSQFFVMFWLGLWSMEKMKKQWHDSGAFALGLMIYTVVKSIPVFGWLLHGFAILAGFGALLVTKVELLKMLKKKKLV